MMSSYIIIVSVNADEDAEDGIFLFQLIVKVFGAQSCYSLQ